MPTLTDTHRQALMRLYRDIERLQPSLARFTEAPRVLEALEARDLDALEALCVFDVPDPDAPPLDTGDRPSDPWVAAQFFFRFLPEDFRCTAGEPVNDPCYQIA